MKILITGAAGFIGSNLVNYLLKNNYEIVTLDNLSSGNNINSDCEFIKLDIRSKDILSIKNIDIIIHLAALTRINPSFSKPLDYLDTNSNGTINILNLAKENKAKVIYAASSSFYAGIYESPYAYSKWLGEQHCKFYNKLYKIPIAIPRFFNVYGPNQIKIGDNATLLGIFEHQIENNLPLTIRGSGEQKRDFIHVLDVCKILHNLINTDFCVEEFDVGTSTNYSINEIVQLFKYKNISYEPYINSSENRNTLATKNKYSLNNYINLKEYVLETKNKIQSYKVQSS